MLGGQPHRVGDGVGLRRRQIRLGQRAGDRVGVEHTAFTIPRAGGRAKSCRRPPAAADASAAFRAFIDAHPEERAWLSEWDAADLAAPPTRGMEA